MEIPIIDFNQPVDIIGKQIHSACITHGFFYIKNHQVSIELQLQLEQVASSFFRLPLKEKMNISMNKGGKAWRGYFPLKGELTSGIPDLKEGLYFGEEIQPHHNDWHEPMHGNNLYPSTLDNAKEIIEEYMTQMTLLGHKIMRGIAVSLGLDKDYFYSSISKNPLQLFRIFHYPPQDKLEHSIWGVGEHTDYGLITILKQDNVGGLQIKTNHDWIDAPPIENTFICNIGDMLDKMTNGYYVSTPHRVLNTSNKDRYSYPFFFDPNFHATIQPLELSINENQKTNSINRWDAEDLSLFEGTYKEYILKKIGKVFPNL